MKSWIKILVIVLIPVLVISGYLLTDWRKASAGNPSLVFKSKSSYKYPETLKYNGLQVSITKLTKFPEEPDAKLANTDCYSLPTRTTADPLESDSTSAPVDFNKALVTEKYKYQYLVECLDAKAKDETPQLWVEFKVKNATDNVLSLDPYSFSIIGDPSIKELRRDIQSGNMAPNEERNFRIDTEYNRHYTGSFRLLVAKGSSSKNLEFSYPLNQSSQ